MNRSGLLGIALLFWAAAACMAQSAGSGTFNLAVTVAGGGTVVSTPPGISCAQGGGDCATAFDAQTPVTLTPKEDSQFLFQGWSNPEGSTSQCPGSAGPCSFILTTDSALVATFVPKTANQPRQMLVNSAVTIVRAGCYREYSHSSLLDAQQKCLR